jgi:hypothetical protein
MGKSEYHFSANTVEKKVKSSGFAQLQRTNSAVPAYSGNCPASFSELMKEIAS